MHAELASADQPLQPAPSIREHLSAFSLIFSALFLTHAALLRLPYFWDEAGFYIPAAHDFLLSGDLVPRTTAANAHPPLLTIYLAGWWKFSGFTPAVTRIAMLIVASFALLGIWRMACVLTNRTIAALTVLCTAAYPVFFAQSTMAHLDMLAAGFTLWGLAAYIERRLVWTAALFSIAAMSKETAIVAPLAILIWELSCAWVVKRFGLFKPNIRRLFSLAVCTVPLGAWFLYLHHRTGFFFGDPGYVQYNLSKTLSALRIAVAVVLRVWHAFGYLNLFVLTLLTLAAMLEPALSDAGIARRRVQLPVQAVFGAVILAYILSLSVLGGAVLTRYLLPIYPLIVLLCVSTLHRRLRWWPLATVVVIASFVAGLVFNPPYRFAPEDNLTYRDYVVLHRQAAAYLVQHAHGARVLTAWPASDEISEPYLGYVKNAQPVVRIDNFSGAQMEMAAAAQGQYDWAYLFSTKYDPPRLLFHSAFWEHIHEQYFDYHSDLSPDVAARLIGGRVVYHAQSRGEWVAIVQIEHVENARVELPH